MSIARVAGRTAFLALLATVVLADPAQADPARPTDFESTVTHLDPSTEAITLKVVGGDGFLELKVDPGHEVIVDGYAGGPWLRVRPDGIVEQNQLSPATYLNADRYQRVDLPPNVSDETEVNEPPQYEQVATGGTFAWHDHRIHWMSPEDPPDRERGDVIFDDWQVPMSVDGSPVVAHGRLVWKESENPIMWIAVGLVAAGITVLAGRGKSTFVAAVAMSVASIAALVTGIVSYTSIPAAAGPKPLDIVLPVVAVIAAAVGLVMHRTPVGVVSILASIAALSGWAIMRISVLSHPVLPTDLPFWLDRTTTAAALGCSVGAAILSVRSGALALRLPDLDFSDEPEPSGAG